MRNINLKQTDARTFTPFQSSEEAWFWYCLCEQLGCERAHGHESKIARPCESSDIIIAVKRLAAEGKLKPIHLQVLSKYGFEQAPPHINFGASRRICSLWQEAMSFLDTLLHRKGIVACFL